MTRLRPVKLSFMQKVALLPSEALYIVCMLPVVGLLAGVVYTLSRH